MKIRSGLALAGLITLMLAQQSLAATPAEYEGFPELYRLQSGDLNGDGRSDLHLKYVAPVTPIPFDDLTIPITPPRPIADFVLLQNSSGGFTVSTVTTAQAATISSWPTVTAQLIPVDVNIDGYFDMLIRGVSGIAPGAQDVIVFAPSTSGAAPTSVRNWDTAFEQFVRDAIGWIENPQHYYDPGIYYACQPTLAWVRVTNSDVWGNVWYSWELQQVNACGNWFDPTGYSIPALNFLNQFVLSLVFGDIISGVDEAPMLSQLMRNVLGVPFMRGTLETGAQDWGMPPNLRLVVGGNPEVEAIKVLDRERLVALFTLFPKIKKTTFCQQSGPHYYNFTETVCPIAGNVGCSLDEVYFGEMVFHPAPGYWDQQKPIAQVEQGYAELNCNRTIPGACDPIRARGLPRGKGIFDGGPIEVVRYDFEYHHENKTKPGHIFHPGTVDRYAKPQTGGVGIAIQTIGNGQGACPSINYYGGLYLFRTLNKFIECHIAGKCGKKHDSNPTHE